MGRLSSGRNLSPGQAMQNLLGINSNVPIIKGEQKGFGWNRDFELHKQAIIGRLTSSIVHEINNPMQVIHGGATLALEDISNLNEVNEYLRLIQRESNRVLALTTLIRSIYTSENYEPKKINLAELIHELLSVVKDDLTHKEIRLNLVSQTETIWVSCVEQQIQLAILNLFLTFNQTLNDLHRNSYSLRLSSDASFGCLEFDLDIPLKCLTAPVGMNEGANSQEVAFSADLISDQGGKLTLQPIQQRSRMRVKIPLADVEDECLDRN